MKAADIDTLPVDDAMEPAKRRMRKQAPKLIASVINDTIALKRVRSIDELRPEHLRPLGGGVDAATYLLNHPEEKVIIKLGIGGVRAESEALQAWQKHHVRVPKMIATGIVPSTKGNKHPIHYLIQRALVDPTGRLFETADAYLVYAPKKARQLGRALGVELNKIHSSLTDRFFGEFEDSEGSQASYKTWNGYMYDAVKKQRKFLIDKVGVDEETIAKVLEAINAHSYVKKGRYLHGDYGIRNVAVKSHDPLKLSVFDPNPLIGDPSWDVSFLINNYEFEKRRLEYDDSQHDLYVRNQQLWTGFKQTYKRRINEQSLRTAQLIQAIYQAQYTITIKDKIGLRVRKEFIKELCKEIIRAV